MHLYGTRISTRSHTVFDGGGVRFPGCFANIPLLGQRPSVTPLASKEESDEKGFGIWLLITSLYQNCGQKLAHNKSI